MTNITHPPSKEPELAIADDLVIRANKALKAKRNRVAYRLYSRALTLFEKLGDMTDLAFKHKVADLYETASYSAYRIYYKHKRAADIEWLIRGNDFSRRTIDLHGQLFVWKRTKKSVDEGFSQVLRLHRLAGEHVLAGNLAAAEATTLEEMKVHLQIAEDSKPSTAIWLASQGTLARAVIGQGNVERALEILNTALTFDDPSKQSQIWTLQDYAELCTLKASLMKKPVQS